MKLSELELEVSTLNPKPGECLLLSIKEELTHEQLLKLHARLSNIGFSNRLLILHSGATLETLSKENIESTCNQLRGLEKGPLNPL